MGQKNKLVDFRQTDNRLLTMALFKATFIPVTVLALLCACALTQGDTADYWIEKGDELTLNFSDREALAAYEKAIQIDPENVGAWDRKALVLDILSKQAYKKVLNLTERKLDNDPEDAKAWEAKSVALLVLGSVEESKEAREKALEIYNQSIENDPKNASAWFGKAENLVSLQRPEEALLCYEKVIELNYTPLLLDAWIAKAAGLSGLQENDQALIAAEKAIELNPGSIIAWMEKGYVLMAAGRQAEADVAFAKARAQGFGG